MIILTIILGYLVFCSIALIIAFRMPYVVIKNKKGNYDEEDIAEAYYLINMMGETYTFKNVLLVWPLVPWLLLIGIILGIKDNR